MFSELKSEEISDRVYRHTQGVWNKFSVKIRGCQNLYNMQDALLLLGAVVDFKIDVNGKYYVEPLNFLILPSLSLKCALK